MMREKSLVETQEKATLVEGYSSAKKIDSLKHLISFISPYKGRVFLAILSLVVVAIVVLCLGWGVRTLIDNGFSVEDQYALEESLTFLVGAVGLLSLASFGRSYLVAWIGERVITDLRQKLFNHLLRLDVGFFETVRSGELVSRLTTDTTLIQIVIGTSVAIAIRNILLFVGGLIMMAVTAPKLTLFSLALVPIVILPILFYGKHVRRLSKTSQDRIAEAGGFLDEVLSSIRTTQAFCHEKVDRQKFKGHTENAFLTSIQRSRAKSLLSCLVMMLVFGGVSFLLLMGGRDVISGVLTAGALSAFIFYAIVAAGSVGSLSEIYADLQRAAGAMERLLDLLATTPLNDLSEIVRPLPTPARGVVAFHNISFAYPSNPQRSILSNVTFSVAPGEKLAIVGASGAGKSTILSLLLRFYTPQSGAIYIDGIDVREATVPDVRARMGIVPQDPVIFSGTIYENILYGRPEARETEVWKAAEAAHLLPIIQDLPKGIHEVIGTRGVRLSGGQKQRLAIARAILRNPAILLLDEATSSLDAESEKLVQDSLKPLMATRTTIVIAHRLATVLKADRIVVLDRGQVQAVGTHAELISEDGLYRRLATLQFADSIEFAGRRAQRESQVLRA